MKRAFTRVESKRSYFVPRKNYNTTLLAPRTVVNASSKFAVFLSPQEDLKIFTWVNAINLPLEKRRLKIENKRVNYLYSTVTLQEFKAYFKIKKCPR
jgi:hypothetical protein